MNVLFVSSQFPNPAEPNKGVFSLQIVRGLGRLASVQVVAPVPSIGLLKPLDGLKRYPTSFRIPRRESVHGITVHHPAFFAMPAMGFTHSWSLYYELRTLLANIHASWRIDTVNCHWLFPDGVAVHAACREARIPLLLTALGSDLNALDAYPWRRRAVSRALRTAGAVSVLSSAMYERSLQLGVERSRLHLIPNGVDLETFHVADRSACRAALDVPDRSHVILFVGSLLPVKNVALLLRAFAGLRETRPAGSLRLYVVGSGFLERDLKSLASELGVFDDTVFVGEVAHSALPLWMNAADCLCLPSLSEGHPNAVMEALACGLPVVASAVGAVPDYVASDTGVLFASNDLAGLSTALDVCLAIRYDRGRIRTKVADLSWINCAAAYCRVLEGLLPATGPDPLPEDATCSAH